VSVLLTHLLLLLLYNSICEWWTFHSQDYSFSLRRTFLPRPVVLWNFRFLELSFPRTSGSKFIEFTEGHQYRRTDGARSESSNKCVCNRSKQSMYGMLVLTKVVETLLKNSPSLCRFSHQGHMCWLPTLVHPSSVHPMLSTKCDHRNLSITLAVHWIRNTCGLMQKSRRRWFSIFIAVATFLFLICIVLLFNDPPMTAVKSA